MKPVQGYEVRFDSLTSLGETSTTTERDRLESDNSRTSRGLNESISKLDEYIDSLSQRVKECRYLEVSDDYSENTSIDGESYQDMSVSPAYSEKHQGSKESTSQLINSMEEITRKFVEFEVTNQEEVADGGNEITEKFVEFDIINQKEAVSDKSGVIEKGVEENDEDDEDDTALGLNLIQRWPNHNSKGLIQQHRDSFRLNKGKSYPTRLPPRPDPTRYSPEEIPDLDSNSSDDSEVLGIILETKVKESSDKFHALQHNLPRVHTTHSSNRNLMPIPKKAHFQNNLPNIKNDGPQRLPYGTLKSLPPKPPTPANSVTRFPHPETHQQYKHNLKMPPPHAFGAKSTPEIITIDILKKIKTKSSPNWMREAKLTVGSDSTLDLTKSENSHIPTNEDNPDDDITLAEIIQKPIDNTVIKPPPPNQLSTRKIKRIQKKTTVRVYIEVPSVFQDVFLHTDQDCAEITKQIIESGFLDKTRDWSLFEINRTFLIERPIFDWETPMNVIIRWSLDHSEEYSFFLKPYPYKLILRPEQVLEKFLTKHGYLYQEVSPNKWKRKYFVLKKGILYSYNSANSAHHNHSCDLSNRHIYTPLDQFLEKDKEKIYFSLVSQTPAYAFCNKNERILNFATTSEQHFLSWFTALSVARAKKEFLTNPGAFVNSSSPSVRARAEELVQAFREDKRKKDLSIVP